MHSWTPPLSIRSEGVSIGKTYVEVAEEAVACGDRVQAQEFIDRAYEAFGLEYLEYEDTQDALDAGSFG